MSLICIENLTFSHEGSAEVLFESLCLQIDTSWRLGLVGRNGRGKTTFLRLLLGEFPYAGRITADCAFAYFPELPDTESRSAMELFSSLCPGCEEWVFLRETGRLGIDEQTLHRSFYKLSGGERTRISLATLFLREGCFPLIDEPTNHLDAMGRRLVAGYLRRQRGFILVSHDRQFLDACTDHTLSINPTGVQVQRGGFSVWWENKQNRDLAELEENVRLKKEIGRLNAAARQTAQWSERLEKTKQGTKQSGLRPDRGYIGHRSAKMMQRSKNIEKRRQAAIDEKSSLLKDVETAETLSLPCLTAKLSRVVEVRSLSILHNGRPVCQNISFTLSPGERLVLCGKNGCGKTSLLRLLLGEELEHTGYAAIGGGIKVSYIPQETSGLSGSLFDYAAACEAEPGRMLAILRKLGFFREQFEIDISRFSAGQKKKVLLARSLCQPAHLYIWDEPLNYMDVISRAQIEEVLLCAQPTMLFVEHDGLFCDRIATRRIEL